MTDAQRRNAIKKAIKRYTDEKSVTKKAAREALIEERIYTRKGKLRVEFGGASKAKSAAA